MPPQQGARKIMTERTLLLSILSCGALHSEVTSMTKTRNPTAATLRWRARLVKSAAAYDSFDSKSVSEDDKKEPEDQTSRWQQIRRSTDLSPVDGIAVLAGMF